MSGQNGNGNGYRNGSGGILWQERGLEFEPVSIADCKGSMISRLNVVDSCRMSWSACALVAPARINTAVAMDFVSLENNFCAGVMVSSQEPLAPAKGRTCKVRNSTEE